MDFDMGNRAAGHNLFILIVFFLLITPFAARADTAAGQAAFEQANAAFRDGDFAAALSGYSEALANGKVGPRVHYNKGLAHLRLGQYGEARRAFFESSSDSDLAALSYYQLGVIANMSGDRDSAERYFERSRASADSDRLRGMADDALETVNAGRSSFEVRAAAGIGYDSNAYRAPGSPYLDVSQDPPVQVVPVELSGGYVPVRIAAVYRNPTSERSTFVASYRHMGDYYVSTDLENADETDHRLKLGVERALGEGNSSTRRFSFDGVLRSHAETYFDRDDGTERFDDGASVADRFDYNGAGIEAELRNWIGRVRYEVDTGFEIRDYEDEPNITSYDLSAYWLGGALKFPLAGSTRLEIGAQYYVRDFDERISRDETGSRSPDNPTIEYHYTMFEAGLRKRLSERSVVELVYARTNRDDQFVGYHDYVQDEVSIEASFETTEKFLMQFEVEYRDQQYENAFAFNEPDQPSKEYQDLNFVFNALYSFTDNLALRAKLELDDVDSSDPRGAYERQRASLSIYWQY